MVVYGGVYVIEMVKLRIKKYVGFLGQKMFLLFVVLATIMQFINKLNDSYITEVKIPITVTVDYGSEYWVEDPRFEVLATVQGKGSALLGYKMGWSEAISLPLSALTIDPKPLDGQNKYLRKIDPQSVAVALSKAQKDLTISQINNAEIALKVSPVHKAKLDIRPSINVECRRQFMQVGHTRLSHDSVEVKAPQAILDTLPYITTKHLYLEDLRGPRSGMVDLIFPESVVSALAKVEYAVDVAGYTEIEFALPIVIDNLPDSLRSVLIPSQVVVLTHVPLRSLGYIGTMREPVAKVDYLDLATNLSHTLEVRVDSLSYGMSVRSIAPPFVEPFFEIVK